MNHVLAQFSPATRRWFDGAFPSPTTAQLGAWEAIGRGEHTLVVAPTGSGKTLAAFLWALDSLARTPAPESPERRCRVLYVSPMKALAVDVEKNLREPLAGIRRAARAEGDNPPTIEVGVRSGDTPASARRAFATRGTDILITTPESLFLLLTSRAREMLRGVEHVIIDEIHAVAGTKRGAHLAVSLERLDSLLPAPAQRIGLSATVRPVEEVQRFLAGGRPVTLVRPPSAKQWDLSITVPVEDMGDPSGAGRARAPAGSLATGSTGGFRSGLVGGLGPGSTGTPGVRADDPRSRSSIWPHMEERIVDLVAAHRSTLVFANSRRLAERLTARLNEIWEERLADGEEPEHSPEHNRRESRIRETTQSTHNTAAGRPAVLARAHHGSVSREQRLEIENSLKAGMLPAVVATSSLELGIDMGEVDLVVQVEAPPSVASGLQRVGRAGHQVGAVSHGVFFPKHRGDLVQTVVVVRRMRESAIESLHIPTSPLDVLAQQVVAMCAMDPWQVDDVLATVRRAAPYVGLTRSVLESVLDMLSGRYPSDEFAELRPRIVWDRTADRLTGRPGAQRLAVTSGGTIPDRGLYGVFVAGEGVGRRVGELDEEMVYETRVGDVFLLGTAAWRVEEITHDQVIVTPAGHQPGRLPFWRADTQGRPAELGAAVGRFLRELGGDAEAFAAANSALEADGLDALARENLLRYVGEQQEQTGRVPDDRTVVVERWRDELGDWQIAVHSVFGFRVNAPWAMVLGARLRDATGVDVQAQPSDDGIVLRLPDSDLDPARIERALSQALLIEPGDVAQRVTDQLGGSPMFSARFRESAARALLLPRRHPGRRQALWQQRQRAVQLLQVASRYPEFPIVLEAVRECLQDVFDVPALERLMVDLAARRVTLLEVKTAAPSPFARTLLFGYVGQFLYEGDQPLAERRAAALALDPVLLEELLGSGAAALADLLDPGVVEEVELELQGLKPERHARNAEDVADLLRRLGPLSVPAVVERSEAPDPPGAAPSSTLDQPGVPEPSSHSPAHRARVRSWLESLGQAGRALPLIIDGEERWIATEDAALMRDALGADLPDGIPKAFLGHVPNALATLVRRYARSHGPFTASEVSAWLGLIGEVFDAAETPTIAHEQPDAETELGATTVPVAVKKSLAELVDAGHLTRGRLRPGSPAKDMHWCDAEILQRLRRRSLAAERAQAEPAPQQVYARFLAEWQGVGDLGSAGSEGHVEPGLAGEDGLLRSIEQLAGVPIAASALESMVLPARVVDYAPAMLDALFASGAVLWQGAGRAPGNDAWLTLHLSESVGQTLRVPNDLEMSPVHEAILGHLSRGGGWAFRQLADAVVGHWEGRTEQPPLDSELVTALWDLAWAGHIANDSLTPVRTLLTSGRAGHRRAPGGRIAGRVGARPRLGALTGSGRVPMPSRAGPPTAAGRWLALPKREADPTVRALADAEVLLDRYGVVTRGAAVAEGVDGGFSAIYRVLSRAEEAGRVRRGYFVEGLGASQFATTGAVDRLRELAQEVEGRSERLRAAARSEEAPARDTGTDAMPSHGSGAMPIHGSSAMPTHGSGAMPTHGSGAMPTALVLAAADPANPYGAALEWPRLEARRPSRSAGAVVVLVDGELVLHLERGARTALTFTARPSALAAASRALVGTARSGRIERLEIKRVDGVPTLGSDHPLIAHLVAEGFIPTPQGYRVRSLRPF